MTNKPLLGVRVKIDRAKKHFNELNAEIRAFQDREPYIVTPYTDLKTRDIVHKLLIVEDIPARWGGAVGDVVHNLRSALDLLANDLVRHARGKPTNHTKFPISSAAKFMRDDIASGLAGASPAAIRLVHLLKPYAGGYGAFWRLHMLDIIDKHRLLVPVGGVHDMIKWTIAMKNPWGDGHFPPMSVNLKPHKRSPLKDGAILLRQGSRADVTDKSKHQHKFVFSVAFGEGQIFDGEAVSPTLKQLIDFIERVINIFAKHIFKCSW